MAKFDKLAVMQKIGETGMVPVFYHSNAETAKKVIKACYDGGVRAFEFTNRGDFAQEVFAECVKFAAKECPELALGIGSVVDAPTAALYIQLGACFVVGPLFNPYRYATAVWCPTVRDAAPYRKSARRRNWAATFASSSPVTCTARLS